MFAFFISLNVHGVTIGQPAPDFTLKDMQGKNFNLTEQRGNIILINFGEFFTLKSQPFYHHILICS